VPVIYNKCTGNKKMYRGNCCSDLWRQRSKCEKENERNEILGSAHKMFKTGNVFCGGKDKQIGLREGTHFKFCTI
jgi:hypothetical protein